LPTGTISWSFPDTIQGRNSSSFRNFGLPEPDTGILPHANEGFTCSLACGNFAVIRGCTHDLLAPLK
jgi:hypothetical protein